MVVVELEDVVVARVVVVVGDFSPSVGGVVGFEVVDWWMVVTLEVTLAEASWFDGTVLRPKRLGVSSDGIRNDPGEAITVRTLATAAKPTTIEAAVATIQAITRASLKFMWGSVVVLETSGG